MQENGREWDSEILRENLIPMDVEAVLKILLRAIIWRLLLHGHMSEITNY
jgi:hypothetical protein